MLHVGAYASYQMHTNDNGVPLNPQRFRPETARVKFNGIGKIEKHGGTQRTP